MGTDIHFVAQARDASGQWCDIPHEYNEDRHYMLFAWLADVRNGLGIDPIAQPRGLPTDFAVADERHPLADIKLFPKWRQEYQDNGDSKEIWMGDHNHSWLEADEILCAKLPTTTATSEDELKYFIDEIKRLKQEYGDVRIVFGFDS